MRSWSIIGAVGFVVLAGTLSAQDGLQKGKIKKVDAAKSTLTITVDGNDQDYLVTPTTRVMAAKKDIQNPFQDKIFVEGAQVTIKAAEKDGKKVLVGILLGGGGGGGGKAPVLKKVDSSHLLPLDELGDKEYQQGFKGGFYPDGKNKRPEAHEAAGLRFAKEVQPRNTVGKPDPNGKIVMLSVGMSNTSQASGGFTKVLASAQGINPHFKFVNGAQGGQTAKITQYTDKGKGIEYWTVVDERLKQAGVTREQVQVIWIKQADGGPTQGFPAYAKTLEEELANLVQLFPKRFPNAKLVYLTSRTYGGYATTPLNPEPYAYESGFSVKWLIERQIKGDASLNFDPAKGEVKAPWLSWGPYFWANGSKKRVADGFSYDPSDFGNDGTHHSPAGSEKIGRLMLEFFKNDATTRSWFAK